MGDRPDARRYPERPIVGVGAVVVRDGQVLIVRRRFEPLAGQWSLPGGGLELGETLEAGVVREVREETGLDVDVGPVVEVLDRITFDDHRKVQYHYVLVDYLCWPTGGDLRPGSDVDDALFAAPTALAQYELTPTAVAVIERGLALARGAAEAPRR